MLPLNGGKHKFSTQSRGTPISMSQHHLEATLQSILFSKKLLNYVCLKTHVFCFNTQQFPNPATPLNKKHFLASPESYYSNHSVIESVFKYVCFEMHIFSLKDIIYIKEKIPLLSFQEQLIPTIYLIYFFKHLKSQPLQSKQNTRQHNRNLNDCFFTRKPILNRSLLQPISY